MQAQAQTEVLQAAHELVAHFAAHDTENYFAAFAPEATFIFHTTPQPLDSREAYRALWRDWEADGFRILDCRSFEPHIRVHGDVAIFTHRVETRLTTGGVEQTTTERETIVFQRQDDKRWLAIHEHLSPCNDT
ncbi:MAG TPA: nuclear transport factor 2 family protein [Acidiphilium sp.]